MNLGFLGGKFDSDKGSDLSLIQVEAHSRLGDCEDSTGGRERIREGHLLVCLRSLGHYRKDSKHCGSNLSCVWQVVLGLRKWPGII